jgi:hypothetical protein
MSIKFYQTSRPHIPDDSIFLNTLQQYSPTYLYGSQLTLTFFSFFNGSPSPLRTLAFYSVPSSFFANGRTPWTSDQLVARPLPKHRTKQTQKKRIHTPNIHALNGIRTTIPADSSYLRPRLCCDRRLSPSDLSLQTL